MEIQLPFRQLTGNIVGLVQAWDFFHNRLKLENNPCMPNQTDLFQSFCKLRMQICFFSAKLPRGCILATVD